VNALTIKSLEKIYQNGTVALKKVSLKVDDGDFFALLGPNGAGKSTLLGIISSLVTKTSGNVSIFDVNIDEDFGLARSMLGIVPQEVNFNQFETLDEILINQAGYYGIPRREATEKSNYLLNKLKLWKQRKNISRTLSGGMKRRLMIARALIHDPKLLLLDEPTAGVDIEIRKTMWDFFKKLNSSGTTIILTTHYLEEAEQLCNRVGIINDGSIIVDTSMTELLSKRNSESFILDCVEKYTDLPELGSANVLAIDDLRFEITVEKGTDLNGIFKELSKSGIDIKSMRNKGNRLETLFLDLTGNYE
tara:strand:+ start:543 stop:1457 length:915 start_codon:yes stop_codon:yes gene_type:complete